MGTYIKIRGCSGVYRDMSLSTWLGENSLASFLHVPWFRDRQGNDKHRLAATLMQVCRGSKPTCRNRYMLGKLKVDEVVPYQAERSTTP